jgi:hypothetical protein
LAIWSIYGHLVYFVATWNILRSFGIFPPCFGMLHKEKPGNPGWKVGQSQMRAWNLGQANLNRWKINDSRT